MNRPRNRQPRAPRNNTNNVNSTKRPSRQPPQNRSSQVPRMNEVLPGASVSIVLKQDQSTGREVRGVVKDVLTRGDHPRGIKVRLQDDRIGRVQRMVAGNSSTNISSTPTVEQNNHPLSTSTVVNCPICGNFEGDETAVSHHVQQHHLDQEIEPPE